MNDHDRETCACCGKDFLRLTMKQVERDETCVYECRDCFFGADEPSGDPDDEWNDEPVGSCEWCGTNIYADDYGVADDLCDQCSWHAEQNKGGEDSGIQPIM